MSVAFESHFWSFDENRFNYSDADLSTHIYHPKQTSKLGSNTFRDYRAKFAEKRKEKLWRLPKTSGNLREKLIELNKLLGVYSISCFIPGEFMVLVLSGGSLVTLSLSNNDPETIKITNNAIPGVSQSNQIISSHGSTDNIICILPNSRLSVISGFLEGKIHQYEVANVPDMPDNACVQTRGPYSAIYWSERTEDGAMGQLLMIHHTKQSLEIASRVRFDSLIQKITFSNVKSNLMWCIEIPDPRSPSTLKLTQFLVKEKGLKVFDSDESKEFLVQLSSSVITSSFSPNDEKILFGCSGKVLIFSGVTRGIAVKIEIFHDFILTVILLVSFKTTKR